MLNRMHPGFRTTTLAAFVAALLAGGPSVVARGAEGSRDIPPHGQAIVLFDGTSLHNFDSFLKTKGLNSDPEHVFSLEKGMIHISGAEFGYLITKREYANYYLRAEFKWGEATHAPARVKRATAEFSFTSKVRKRSGRLPSNFKSAKGKPATSI